MNTYHLYDIEWNTEDEDLPEEVLVTTTKTWNSDVHDTALEVLSEYFAWEIKTFTHEKVVINDDTKDTFCGVEVFELT